MEYYREYKKWSELKEILNEIEIDLPFVEAEIWWVSFGVNIGIEIDGKGEFFERPALIIKKLNRHHAWVIPTTNTHHEDSSFYTHVTCDKKSFTLVLTQLQTISNKRLLRRISILRYSEFERVINLLKNILS